MSQPAQPLTSTDVLLADLPFTRALAGGIRRDERNIDEQQRGSVSAAVVIHPEKRDAVAGSVGLVMVRRRAIRDVAE